jgi:CRP/FNR family cyclic AMP-dependent transcriptional regulator
MRRLASRRDTTPGGLRACLLDLDDELAEALDARARMAARPAVVAEVLHAETGGCTLSPWLARVGGGHGLLILDGLLAVDTRIAGRTASELLGAGDLLAPAQARVEELVRRECSWRVLSGTRIAVLDDAFGERVRAWPQIARSIARRCERRAENLAFLRAITSQPRLELRLVLLLWHLGWRWGRVEPGGLHLSLPLTHRLLGQLIAAERPSVTHALARLSRAGLVTGATNDLHLAGDLPSHLRALAVRSPRRCYGAELPVSSAAISSNTCT